MIRTMVPINKLPPGIWDVGDKRDLTKPLSEKTLKEIEVGRALALLLKWNEERKIGLSQHDPDFPDAPRRVIVGYVYIDGPIGDELVARVALALQAGVGSG